MRTILAIVVISYFFAVAMSQSASCVARANAANLANCIASLALARAGTLNQGDQTEFCNECGNSLFSYYQACVNGGAGPVQEDIIESKLYCSQLLCIETNEDSLWVTVG